MENLSPAHPRRPNLAQTALALVVAAGLVGAVVLTRDVSQTTTTAADLERIADSVQQGCAEPSSDLAPTTGLALDGTVGSITVPADPGSPVVVELEVAEWFRGPPLDRVRVRVDPTTVRALRDSGEPLAPGVRLLVSGPGWGAGSDAPAAAGCGRTRLHDTRTADDWREQLAAPGAVVAVGPLARYLDAGYVSTNADNAPALTGVLLLDDGCLYVDDGLTRWVPVFPASTTGWVDQPPQLRTGFDVVDAGHFVRLGGTPATGVARRGVRELTDAETTSLRVAPGSVPEGCNDDAPRFVVADPPEEGPADEVRVAADDPLVQGVLDGADAAGLSPTEVTGEVRRDAFGAASARVVAETERAGRLLVHVESVSYLAWPTAYVPSDATLRWSLDPKQAQRLPSPAPGTELAVVERADGSTQLLVRTSPRVVVSVTTDPSTAPGDPLTGRRLLDALAQVAAGVGVARSAAAPPP